MTREYDGAVTMTVFHGLGREQDARGLAGFQFQPHTQAWIR